MVFEVMGTCDCVQDEHLGEEKCINVVYGSFESIGYWKVS